MPSPIYRRRSLEKVFGHSTFMRKYAIYILELLDIEEQDTEFFFRKHELNMIYNAYSNKLSFKYYISILGGRGSEAMLILLPYDNFLRIP